MVGRESILERLVRQLSSFAFSGCHLLSREGKVWPCLGKVQ